MRNTDNDGVVRKTYAIGTSDGEEEEYQDQFPATVDVARKYQQSSSGIANSMDFDRNDDVQMHRTDIDGLKVIGMVFVGLGTFEMIPKADSGYIIFFVISGYLTTISIVHQRTNSWIDYFLSYFSRKCQRLFPAQAAVIAGASIVASICCMPLLVDNAFLTALLSTLGLSNITSWSSYRLNSLFSHLWALSLQSQFFFLAPFVFSCTRVSGPHQDVGIGLHRSIRLFSVLTVVSFLSFLFLRLNVFFTYIAHMSLLGRAWQFSFGIITALIRLSGVSPSNGIFTSLITLGLLIFVAAMVPRDSKGCDIVASLSIATLSAIFLFLNNWNNVIGSLLNLLSPISNLCYCSYLWLWPTYVIAYHLHDQNSHGFPFKLTVCLSTCIAALMSFVFFEYPLRKLSYSNWMKCIFWNSAILWSSYPFCGCLLMSLKFTIRRLRKVLD
eukprot:GHVH01016069.1.p1 GENE.GHVH01016069.1~~GHVH01016069.1.p1  ORF type:complete len:440 (+),score=23.58 GHVH01016069.1:90-1409(+)